VKQFIKPPRLAIVNRSRETTSGDPPVRGAAHCFT
jgi:hypothetical protein